MGTNQDMKKNAKGKNIKEHQAKRQPEKMPMHDRENQIKSKKPLIIIILLCITIILAAIGYFLYINRQPEKDNTGSNAIIVTEDTRDAQGDINAKVAKGMIDVKMTRNWVFEDGGKTSNAYLANSERNSYDLRFEITLEDTGEVIMESPDVPIGSCVENFPLSVTLDPGEYNVVIAHQQVENGEVINTVRTTGTITVN